MASVLVLAAGEVGCSTSRRRTDVSLIDGKEMVFHALSSGSPRRAQALVEGVWDLGPRFPTARIDTVTWTEDPFQDNYWRFIFYSLRPTANLLWAYYTSGDTIYRDKLVELLRSFAAYDAAHPDYDPRTFGYLHGAGWRALVLVNTYRKLERSGDLPPALAADLLSSLERLGRFLAEEVNYESDFNHGFAEASGLLMIAANFPEMADASPWLALALRRLEALVDRTVDDDGVEVENSPFYHFYVYGFSWEIAQWARRHEVPLTPRFAERVETMLRFATHILQPDGEVPRIGASVDLESQRLDEGIYGAAAARDPGFAWVYTRGANGVAPSERAVLFPRSGLAVLRSGFGTGPADFAGQSHVTFNAGPWRGLHSHLDVLGINHYAAGATLLPDSGLYTYDAGVEKDYFFSTAAHNAVVVDGVSQAQTGIVRAGRTVTGPTWAYQSGLHELYLGVTHRRAVLVLDERLTVVCDVLTSSQPHDYVQTWHLPPGYSAGAAPEGADAAAADGVVRFALRQALPEALSVALVLGATEPMQGWYSEVYGKKVPSYALEYRARAPEAVFLTLLAAGEGAAGAPRIVATAASTSALEAAVCAGESGYAIAISDVAGEAEEVAVTPGAACPPASPEGAALAAPSRVGVRRFPTRAQPGP